MRFFQSIRWRLQLWHGVLLAVVLTGFGITSWRFEQSARLQRVDQELERRVAAITDVMRRGGPMPARPPQGRLPGDRPPEPRPSQDPPPDDRPPDARPPRPADERRPPRPEAGRRPPREPAPLDATADGVFYYVAWDASGQVLTASEFAPADVPVPDRTTGQRAARLRGTEREYIHVTPQGDRVLVGRDVSVDLAALRRFALLLLTVGGGVFVLGLAGGWWISARALRPIAVISATAARISTGDLTQRVPTTAAGSELDDLARVLNEMFARLQASFARQAQFTADASHELRTPVTVLLTQTQSALARDRPAAEYRETLAACHRAAQRMRGLTESLLTLARLDSGDASARTACDLDRVAAEAVDLLRPLAQEHGVALTCDLRPARCHASTDQIGQVVTNLVSNAIYYNAAGGTAHVQVTHEAGAAVLSVRDSGHGIDPRDLPQIFERFFRTDRARSSASGRTGLGLAIVKAIVDAHGGAIDVVSEEGRGSTFTIRLPASSAAGAWRPL